MWMGWVTGKASGEKLGSNQDSRYGIHTANKYKVWVIIGQVCWVLGVPCMQQNSKDLGYRNVLGPRGSLL